MVVQFLKAGDSSEARAVRKLDKFRIKSFGRKGFSPFTDKDRALAEKGVEFFKKEIANYDLVVLDEINVAISAGLIKVGDVTALLKKYGARKDLVLTGRNCPRGMADLVTDFREVKHYFKKGVKARKGIEY